MKKIRIVIGIAMLLAAALGCETTTSQEGFQMLRAAQTPEEEAAAFEMIQESGAYITIMPYDVDGNPLDMTLTDWWEDLHHIRLIVGPTSTDHEMIDPENILILMQE